jgi:Tfp pilus assembly protein PilF
MPQASNTPPGRNDPCPCGSGRKYKKCCQQKPAGPALLLDGGITRAAALLEAGLYLEGESLARRLIERFPTAGIAWRALGHALQRQGKDARQAAFKACELLPHDAGAFIDLGVAFQYCGQLDNAAAAYQQALQRKPDSAEAHSNLGNVLKDLGQLDAAAASIRRALAIRPDMADLHNNLGNVLADQGQLDEAIAGYRRALQLKPDLCGAHNNIGLAMQGLERFDEAVASYRSALQISPDFAEAHSNLGNALLDLGRLAEALTCYQRALQLQPNYADAHGNLGSLLMHLGRIADGERHLSTAIALSGGDARSLATALAYLPYRKEDPRFQRLESVYGRRESLRKPDRIKLSVAMGQAMESVGEYALAFNAYTEGNRLNHQAHPFDERAADARLDKSRRVFMPELFARFAAMRSGLSDAEQEPVPIFIVGMPRSGTTLIEQVLASHPAIFGAGELRKLGELAQRAEAISLDVRDGEATLQTLRALGREYLEHVRGLAAGRRYVTDKMPDNYQLLWLIRLMLPNAKIIHSLRDPLDTCFSCFALQFASGHEYSYELGMLGRHYVRYRRLMRHWQTALPAGCMLEVRYEDNVADPERQARRMLEYLGLAWDPACLRFHQTERTVSTASAAQVRRPMYGDSIARWKRFKPFLQPLLQAINDAGDL